MLTLLRMSNNVQQTEIAVCHRLTKPRIRLSIGGISGRITVQPVLKRKRMDIHQVKQWDREPPEPHCLKCEGGHRLEDCSFFRELPVSNRMTLAQQRGLCYSCLGHGALNCSFKRACGVEGCKLTHHHLLHRERAQPDRRVRPHTLHTG